MTPEQQQAQADLDAAIRAHVQAFQPVRTQQLMVADYVVVVNLVGYDNDGDRVVAYHMGFSDGHMDDHRAVGLCTVGSDLVRGITKVGS